MSTIPWYRSRTIQGLIVSALAQVLTRIGGGESISAEDVALNLERLLDLISFLTSFAGLGWAAWNRARNPSPPITQMAAKRSAERETI